MTTPYASAADLQAIEPQLTAVQAQRLLDQVGARLDAALRAAGYPTVPATGVNDLLLLGPAVLNMAAAQGHRELYQDGGDAPERVEAWERQFNALLSDVIKGTLQLQDQVVATVGGLSVGTLRFISDDSIQTEYGR